MSQLDLALRAGFSARHVSFIETGRSQPSREALLALAEVLNVPLRERNRLLEAGGYAQVFTSTPLDAGEMTHVRGVLQFILDRHEPYAAVVLDRYANLVMANASSSRLLVPFVDASLLAPPVNYLRLVFHPLGARRFIVNWEDVAHHLLFRAEEELGHAASDDDAAALLRELRSYDGGTLRAFRPRTIRPADLLLPVHLRRDNLELRLFSTIMSLGTPRDVTLQELRIETFFPADEASERVWRGLQSASPSSNDDET
jgi:transcriptional regulator with XRE-family HTH domain